MKRERLSIYETIANRSKAFWLNAFQNPEERTVVPVSTNVSVNLSLFHVRPQCFKGMGDVKIYKARNFHVTDDMTISMTRTYAMHFVKEFPLSCECFMYE